MATNINNITNVNSVFTNLEASKLDSEYFLKKYEISFSNIEALDQADIFLVGNDHFSETDQRNLGLFISYVAKLYPLTIFLEGTASLKEIEATEYLASSLNLDFSTAKEIRFYGWDANNLLERMGNAPATAALLLKLMDETEDRILTIMKEIESLCPGFWNIAKNEISNLLFSMPIDLLNKISTLMNMKDKLEEQMQFLQKELNKGIADEQKAKQTFPDRTQAMVATLRYLRQLQAEGKLRRKIIIIAGSEHLKTKEANLNIKEYCLDLLYEELKFQKAAVMIPNSYS